MTQEKKADKENYQELSKNNFVELGWNDPEKKDFLVVVSSKPFKEVMAANAKGTTVYEMIDLYGGVDNVSKVFPGTKSMYGDATGMPEMFSPEQLEAMAAKMTDLAKSMRHDEVAPSEQEKEVEKGENNESGSVTEQEVK